MKRAVIGKLGDARSFLCSCGRSSGKMAYFHPFECTSTGAVAPLYSLESAQRVGNTFGFHYIAEAFYGTPGVADSFVVFASKKNSKSNGTAAQNEDLLSEETGMKIPYRSHLDFAGKHGYSLCFSCSQ